MKILISALAILAFGAMIQVARCDEEAAEEAFQVIIFFFLIFKFFNFFEKCQKDEKIFHIILF